MHAVASVVSSGLLALLVPIVGASPHEVEWHAVAAGGVAPTPSTGAEARTWGVPRLAIVDARR
ncbi:MAG: hypothetical protein IT453_00970 [Planctomycetes bacterium]|nr:hypothetical protein [Planctomycetota bacterium]